MSQGFQHGWSDVLRVQRIRVRARMGIVLLISGFISLSSKPLLAQTSTPSGSTGVGLERSNAPDGWLGLVLHTRGGLAFVKRVIEGWPAADAGILPGDQLLSVGSVMAQAPRLNRALNALAGPAGESIEVRVMRAGETEPRSYRLVRSASPIPAQKAAPPRIAPAPEVLLSEAVERTRPGQDTLLRQMLLTLERAEPLAAPALYLQAVLQLIARGDEPSVVLARSLARELAERFPTTEEGAEALLRAMPLEDKEGQLQQAARALQTLLKVPPPGVSTVQLESARVRARALEAVGLGRKGRVNRALRKLQPLLGRPRVDLMAVRADGSPVWDVPVRVDPLWQAWAELATIRGRSEQLFEGLDRILPLEQPPWIEPAISLLSPRDLADIQSTWLEPRWSLPRQRPPFRSLADENGDVTGLADLQRGKPMVMLWCGASLTSCEAWRLPLATLMVEKEGLEQAGALMFAKDAPVDPKELVWPAAFVTAQSRTPAVLTVLDAGGMVVLELGAYVPGFEHKVVRLLEELQEDPSAGGPWRVQGGMGLSQLELRLGIEQLGSGGLAWPRTSRGGGQLWISTQQGTLERLEDGASTTVLDSLAGITQLGVVELDGDRQEELLFYHSRDRMLEALEPSGTPLWILPEEQGVEQTLTYDLNGDGLHEICYVRQGDAQLRCVDGNRTPLFSWTSPGGVMSVGAGKLTQDGPGVAIGNRTGSVVLLNGKGVPKGELRPGFLPHLLSLADLDGDGLDEILVGNRQLSQLQAADLNGDGLAEVVAVTRQQQVLIFSHDGRQEARLAWTSPDPILRIGDLDGDGRSEVSLVSGERGAVLEWTGALSSPRLVPIR